MAEPEISGHEVLVSVKAAGICGSDIPRIFENGTHRMPLIPGHEFSGEVVRVGKAADHNWRGKRVGVFPLIPCRNCKSCLNLQYEMCGQYSYLGSRTNGGFAEYVAVPEWNLMELPEGVPYEEAAMLEPMAVAVHAMNRLDLKTTDTVVVAGLGTIGLLLTMFLIERGIRKLLVIGRKDLQKRTAMKLGIPEGQYCDSRTENVKTFVMRHTEGEGADAFFECVGTNETISLAIDLTAPAGQICMVGNPYTDLSLEKNIYWKLLRNQLRVTGSWNSSYRQDWQYVLTKLQQGRIAPADLITQKFTMEELEQGLSIMHDKTEDYIKIMLVQ